MVFPQGTIAYSYVRISTSKQSEGDGPGRQIALSQKYAARHGLILDETLEDIGRSGWSGANINKGALGRFLEMIAAGQIAAGSVLLVESLDRLSRQHPLDAQVHLTAILTSGVSVVTLQDQQVYSSQSLREDWTKLVGILAIQARAHEESQRKSQLAKSAHAKRRRLAMTGESNFSTNVPSWISQKPTSSGKAEYVLNEHAEAVRLIFELAKDGLGQIAITKELNRRGIKPPRSKSKAWHGSTVSRIMDNHATYGTFVANFTDLETGAAIAPVPNYFPAIVTEADFLVAQRYRIRKINKGRKGGRFTNLFNGLCVCMQCGGNMVINYTGKGEKNRAYLRCSNSWLGNGCREGAKRFAYDELESVVLDTIREFAISDFVGKRTANPELKALEETILVKQAAIEELAKREANLVERLSMVSSASANVLAKALDQLQVEKLDAERELKSARDNRNVIVGSQKDFNDIDSIIRDHRARWPEMSDDEVYRSRSQVNAAIRYLFTHFIFDIEQRKASLVFANGLFSYHFQKGKLIGTTDMLSNGMITNEPGSMTLDHFTTHVGKSNPNKNTDKDWQDLETEQTLIGDYMKHHNAGIMRKRPIKGSGE